MRDQETLKKEILETIEKEELITPTEISRINKINYYQLDLILQELLKEKKIEIEKRKRFRFVKLKSKEEEK